MWETSRRSSPTIRPALWPIPTSCRPRSWRARSWREPLPPALYDDLQPLVDQAAGSFLLRQLITSSPCSIGECVSAARKALDLPEPIIRATLTWLLKQGLLEKVA